MGSLFVKAAFWMLLTTMLIMLSSLLVPNDNTHNEVSFNSSYYIIFKII